MTGRAPFMLDRTERARLLVGLKLVRKDVLLDAIVARNELDVLGEARARAELEEIERLHQRLYGVDAEAGSA